jgi:hypothetical protein
MTRYEITYGYTPALLRAVARAYFWRRYAGFVIASLASILWALVILGSQDLSLPAAFLLGFNSALWWSWWRMERQFSQSAGNGFTLRVILDEEGCEFEMPEARSRTAWRGIQKIRRLKAGWIVERRSYYFLLLPTSALTPEIQTYVESKVRENGGRVL